MRKAYSNAMGTCANPANTRSDFDENSLSFDNVILKYFGIWRLVCFRSHDVTCGNHGAVRNGCARANKSLSRYPTVTSNGDWQGNQIKSRLAEIVGTSAQKCTLGNTNVWRDCNFFQTKNQYFLANPNVITNFQSPWERNIYAWAYHNSGSNFSPKTSKQPNSESRRKRQWRHKKQCPNHDPANFR